MENRIYIGDNLQTMEAEPFHKFYGKVNFIYIDPPYNTKNTFSYNDNNDEWTNDILLRLQVAKKVLSKQGVIFISIDDSELSNLLYLCYKVFGKENYVGLFITKESNKRTVPLLGYFPETIFLISLRVSTVC